MSAAVDYSILPDVYDIELRLLPSQYEFVGSDYVHTAFVGGLGSGKTYCGAIKLILRALAPQNWAAKGYIGANTYKQLYQATLSTLFQVMDEFGIWYKFKVATSELWIEDRPAPILCYSLENYNALRGIELGFAWLDETSRTKEDAFRVVVGRLRHRGADLSLDITTTPDGFNWLYDRFVTDLEDNPELCDLRTLIHASTYENYHLPDQYFYNLEATFDALMLRQEVDGEFINIFGGRCYRTFSRVEHLA